MIRVLVLLSLVCCFSNVNASETLLPKRIVTLAPSLGELASDLLGPELDRIVGVSEFTDYPPTLSKIPSIGPYVRINVEKVLSLKPDLVLGTVSGNSKEQVEQLIALGLHVLTVKAE